MIFVFGEYRFFSDTMVLYLKDELVPLKPNQAALLKYFLSHPQGVLSKERILDHVWKGKVVSEQAVFQTVSQLRRIIDNNCIKTYSKIGYQWQLPVVISQEAGEPASAKHAPLPTSSERDAQSKTKEASQTDKGQTSGLKALYGLSLVVVILGWLIWSQISTDNDEKLVMLVEPGQHNLMNAVNRQLGRTNWFETQQISVSPYDQFNQPLAFKGDLDFPSGVRVLWGRLYADKQGLYYQYKLTKGEKGRQGVIYAADVESLLNVVLTKLSEIDKQGYFSIDLTDLELVRLKKWHQEMPADPDALMLLARYYERVQQVDVALTYLQKIIRQPQTRENKPYLAEAYLRAGLLYKHANQFDLAEFHLLKASELLDESGFWWLMFENIKTKAWLFYAQTKYTQMIATLEQGMSLAKQFADPISQFELHILYSILADKTGDQVNKHVQLNQAHVLLLNHQLDTANLAFVHYHYALFSKEQADAVHYFKQVLQLPTTSKNFRIQHVAREKLVEYYLSEEQFVLARELLPQELQSAKEKNLAARIMLVQGEQVQAAELFQQAFDQARVDYDIQAAILAAFNLYKLSSDESTRQVFLAYLEQHAREDWFKQHRPQLALEEGSM